jgi:hypothetical protein
VNLVKQRGRKREKQKNKIKPKNTLFAYKNQEKPKG